MGNSSSSRNFIPRDERTKAVLAAVQANDIVTFTKLCDEVNLIDIPDWDEIVRECRSAEMLNAMILAERSSANRVVLYAKDEILLEYSRIFFRGRLFFIYSIDPAEFANYERTRIYERLIKHSAFGSIDRK